MKLYKTAFALLLGLGTLTSCNDRLNVENPNNQPTTDFGKTADDLEEAVIAAYNHIRMEGTYARVGYNYDVCRGDEAWNASQVWYLPFDDLNVPYTDEMTQWVWRDWFYTINVCNFIISRCSEDDASLSQRMKRIKGQALFLRGLSYYNLTGYYQNPPIVTTYDDNAQLSDLYPASSNYDAAWDQVEKDFKQAMSLLPSRSEGGEWAGGRATNGAAAGYYARALMMRHKYSEALDVLKDILSSADGGNQLYGTYRLMKNYGDNFREGPDYENNEESLFEVQFLDLASQGTDDEWTPVNTSPNATQGHAIESNFGPGDFGGWADISASPWLYHLFLAEKTTANKLDPRLYWTIGTYEADWEGFENGNVCYKKEMTSSENVVTNNINGGLPIAKNTNLRTNLISSIVTGLHCGINLRLMRYSDVLLRAAECENEVNGPTQQAIDWINQVRNRAGLADLKLADFSGNADKLFEQIANVERPKEFGCEFGRGFDLIRWGFFYTADRLKQLKEHGTFRRSKDKAKVKQAVNYADISSDDELKSSYDSYVQGHEFLPIYQGISNGNPNIVGNSANYSTNNSAYFTNKGWTIHPVVDL